MRARACNCVFPSPAPVISRKTRSTCVCPSSPGAGSEQLRQALSEWVPVKDNGALAGPAAEAVKQALAGCEGVNGADTAGANALRYIQVSLSGGGGGPGVCWVQGVVPSGSPASSPGVEAGGGSVQVCEGLVRWQKRCIASSPAS